MVSFTKLWENHPGKESKPCSFPNQCAVRMGVALQKSGVDLSTFRGQRCWFGHSPGHILRAQELADWISGRSGIFGYRDTKSRKKHKNLSYKDYHLKQGIVFIQNGWAGGTDHIDLWNGFDMKGGKPEYFSLGEAVWFWELS